MIASYSAPGVTVQTYEMNSSRAETFDFLLRAGRQCAVQEFSQRYAPVPGQARDSKYSDLIQRGVANECARAFLQRDMTPSRLYFSRVNVTPNPHSDEPLQDVYTTEHFIPGLRQEPGAFMGFCARVSNPGNQFADDDKVLRFCKRKAHWSPFTMEWIGIRLRCPQYVAHQLVRHSTGVIGGFRYLKEPMVQELRTPAQTNRQASIETNIFETVDDPTGLIGEPCEFVFSANVRTWYHMLEVRDSLPNPPAEISTQKEAYTCLRTQALPKLQEILPVLFASS